MMTKVKASNLPFCCLIIKSFGGNLSEDVVRSVACVLIAVNDPRLEGAYKIYKHLQE